MSFKIKTEKVSETRASIVVDIPAEGTHSVQKSILGEYSKQAELPGFRKGKAPAALIEKKFASQLRDELKRRVLMGAYQEITKEEDLKLYGVVDLDGEESISAGEAVTLTFTVDTHPSFEMPNIDGIKVEQKEVTLEDGAVDKQIETMLKQQAEYNTVERAAKVTDYVKLGYEGSIDGQLISEIAPEKTIWGTQKVTWEEAGADTEAGLPGIPAIVAGIVGMAANDTAEFTHAFEKDFEVEALAGKTATYKVEVQEVRERVLPEMDAEFFKKIDVKDEADLRTRIEESLKSREQGEARGEAQQAVVEQLSAQLSFEVPASAVENETQQAFMQRVQQLAMSGTDKTDIEKDRDDILEKAKEEATKNVRVRFVLEKLAEENEIQPDQNDLQQRLYQEAMMRRTDPGKLLQELQGDEQKLAQFQHSVRMNKALDWLTGKALGEESASAETAAKAGAKEPAAAKKSAKKATKKTTTKKTAAKKA